MLEGEETPERIVTGMVAPALFVISFSKFVEAADVLVLGLDDFEEIIDDAVARDNTVV